MKEHSAYHTKLNTLNFADKPFTFFGDQYALCHTIGSRSCFSVLEFVLNISGLVGWTLTIIPHIRILTPKPVLENQFLL